MSRTIFYERRIRGAAPGFWAIGPFFLLADKKTGLKLSNIMVPDFKFCFFLLSGEIVYKKVKTFKKGLSYLKKFSVQIKYLEIFYPDPDLADEFGRPKVSSHLIPFPLLMEPAKTIEQVRYVLNAPAFYPVYRDYLDPQRLQKLCYGEAPQKRPPIGPLGREIRTSDKEEDIGKGSESRERAKQKGMDLKP